MALSDSITSSIDANFYKTSIYGPDNLTSHTTEPVLPCNGRGFGSQPAGTVGAQFSKPSGAGLIPCSQVVHR